MFGKLKPDRKYKHTNCYDDKVDYGLAALSIMTTLHMLRKLPDIEITRQGLIMYGQCVGNTILGNSSIEDIEDTDIDMWEGTVRKYVISEALSYINKHLLPKLNIDIENADGGMSYKDMLSDRDTYSHLDEFEFKLALGDFGDSNITEFAKYISKYKSSTDIKSTVASLMCILYKKLDSMLPTNLRYMTDSDISASFIRTLFTMDAMTNEGLLIYLRKYDDRRVKKLVDSYSTIYNIGMLSLDTAIMFYANNLESNTNNIFVPNDRDCELKVSDTFALHMLTTPDI